MNYKLTFLASIIFVLSSCSDNTFDIESVVETNYDHQANASYIDRFVSKNKINTDEAILACNDLIKSSTRSTPVNIMKIETLQKSRYLSNSENYPEIPDTLAYMFYTDDERCNIVAADNRVSDKVLASISAKCINGLEDNAQIVFDNVVMRNLTGYIVNEIKQYELVKDSIEKLLFARLENVIKTRAGEDPQNPIYDPQTYTFETRDIYLTGWIDIQMVGPLLNIAWEQDAPYNNYVKDTLSCGTVLTGCGATAAAMVLAYWQYPQSLDGVTFNWSALTNSQKINTSNSTLCHQVASLMKSVGIGIQTNYYCEVSTSTLPNVKSWLSSIGYLSNTLTTFSYSALKNSLDNLRPIIIRGENIYGYGHSWIIDGYRNRQRTVRRQVYAIHNVTGQEFLVSDDIITEYNKMANHNWGLGDSNVNWLNIDSFQYGGNQYNSQYPELTDFAYNVYMCTNIRPVSY